MTGRSETELGPHAGDERLILLGRVPLTEQILGTLTGHVAQPIPAVRGSGPDHFGHLLGFLLPGRGSALRSLAARATASVAAWTRGS